MAEIDTSTYPKPQASNPLQMPLQAQQMQSNALGLYKAGQEIQARTALGPILQQSIDPNTGELDYNHAFQLMSSDPRTAWMAPDFLNQAVQRQAIQKETALRDLKLHSDRFAEIGKTAQGLLANGNAGDRQAVISAAADLYNNGVIPREQYMGFIQQLPATPGLTGDKAKNDPALLSYIKGMAARGMTASETMDHVYGKFNTVDAGGQIIQQREAPMMQPNGPQQVGVVTKSLTPTEATSMVPAGTGPNGEQYQEPKGDLFNRMQGQNPAGVAASPVAGSPGQSNPPSSAPATPLPQSNKIVSQQGPLAQEEQKKFGDMGEEIQKELSAANNIMQLVAAGREELQHVGTGPGAANFKRLAEVAKSLGASDDIVNKIAGGSLSDSQAFESTMLQLATAMMKKALEGGGRFTNLEFDSFLKTKPNLSMTPDAITKTYNLLEAGQKAAEAQLSAYNMYRDAGLQGHKALTRSGFQEFFQPHAKKIQDWISKGGLNQQAVGGSNG